MTESVVMIGVKPVAAPTNWDEAEDRLEQALDTYERRPHQTALAHAVEQAITGKRHLAGQAGCGTGKSFATLIPAILSGKTVVISTATKALQDQLANKDLPFLKEHLGVDFDFAVLKGRSNYACQIKMADPDVISQFGGAWSEITDILADESATGEREELPSMNDHQWRSLTITTDDCLGKNECPFAKECFAEKARAAAKKARVIVVNHALLMTDLVIKDMSEGTVSMLPDYDLVIIDEAHELEGYATNVLGTQFSEGSVRFFTSELRNFAGQVGELEVVEDAIDRVMGGLVTLWPKLPDGRITKADIREAGEEWVEMANSLHDLAEAIGGITLEGVRQDEAKAARLKLRRLGKRAWSVSNRFGDLVTARFDQLVRWVEVVPAKGRREAHRVINSAPIEIGEILDGLLFSQVPVVLVSATLFVDGSPDHIAGRLGLTDFDAVDVGTPFDFTTQAMLYVPRHLPDPSKERAAWSSMIVEEIRQLVMASQGRALLLFTSFKEMRNAYDVLSDMLPFGCRMQGQDTNKALVEWFKGDKHSVLFATRSFFTGVDVPGEALSLLVIDKVPFTVPDDPIFQARCEVIDGRGGNSFTGLAIPEMILPLEQGVGRLIRHTTDTGVMAILDPRVMTKPYGRKIRRSLPDAPLVHTVAEVQAFFDRTAA